MIKLKEMSFSNSMSYGENNIIRFDNKVLQLVGKNGAGKSSIPVILEEALYNKNSRGIKKADILNRYLPTNKYCISLLFDVGADSYFLRKDVASTTKLILSKNGDDISGHTTTQTYKILEGILGLDFNTFTKLVYQSMSSSLDFLTATDANRKKFLVSLLGLESYAETEKAVKEAAKITKDELAHVKGRVDTVKAWVAENSDIKEEQGLVPVSTKPTDLEESLKELEIQAGTIQVQNRDISTNLENKKALEKVKVSPIKEASYDEAELREVEKALADIKGELLAKGREVSKLKNVKDTCPTCGSKIDISKTLDILKNLEPELESIKEKASSLDEAYKLLMQDKQDTMKYVEYLKNLQHLETLYDSTKPTELLDIASLQADIAKYKTDIKNCNEAISKAEAHNRAAEIHNSKVHTQRQQLAKFTSELTEQSATLEELTDIVNNLNILVEAFGSKGLISYKIESMVKVFEELINEYLSKLSDGRFALSFTIEGTKLALKLYDSAKEVDIRSLSSGEFNRVNTATLLAVRRMMTAVSKVHINVLFLDEVVSVLDKEGKDTLIDILLKENDLNSVVVSHGYTHPLTDKLTVNKVDNISRLI